MKVTFFFLSFYFFACSQSLAQEEPQIDMFATKALMEQLASDQFEGRKNATNGFNEAAKLASGYLKNSGVFPFLGDTYYSHLNYTDVEGYNIVGFIGNFDLARPTIVIGAHLDHLGTIDGEVFNGANDNASGSVAVLQIAQYLTNFEFDKNIVVALFTAEEDGLLGSYDLARKFHAFGITVEMMINFEMIGLPMSEDNPNQVYISGYDCSNFAQKANEVLDFEFITKFQEEQENLIFQRSDNLSFYKFYKIPSHSICAYTIGNDKYYHKPKDDVSHIDYDFLHQTIVTSARMIKDMIQQNVEVEFYGNSCSKYMEIPMRKKYP